MVETSSEGVTFIILSNVNDGAPLRKQPTAKFRKKAPPQTSDQIPNADLTGSAVNVGSGWAESAWNSLPQAGVQRSG